MAATHPFYGPEHEVLRDTLRRWVERELVPHVDAWDEAGSFPRELYVKAAEVGLLGLGFPERYGGTPGDAFMRLIASVELARAGSGGLAAGLMSHQIGLGPIVALAPPELAARIVPAVLAGQAISALAITEPSGGSDVAALQTRARRDGDEWVLDGAKTFITSGLRADWFTVAARTGGPGMGGISLFAVPADAPGLSRTAIDRKMGWWCSDTATVSFSECRIPSSHLLGAEHQGFLGIMQNFNSERLGIASLALGFCEVCYDEALAWAKQRHTFGKPLVKHQVIRHKLVAMRQRIEALRSTLELLSWRVDRGQWPIAEVCLAKNQATQALAFVASEAVQILGGAGYVRGVKSERIYREVKVLAIGGGAEEVMAELAARQLGIG